MSGARKQSSATGCGSSTSVLIVVSVRDSGKVSSASRNFSPILPLTLSALAMMVSRSPCAANHLAAVFGLASQRVWHCATRRFVFGIQIIPKRLSLGIKDDRHQFRAIADHQLPEHVEHDLDGLGALAARRAELTPLTLHRMKSTEQIGRAIDEYQRATSCRHGKRSQVQQRWSGVLCTGQSVTALFVPSLRPA